MTIQLPTQEAPPTPAVRSSDYARIKRRAVPALAVFAGSVIMERWGFGFPHFIRNYAEDVVDFCGLVGVASFVFLPLYHRKKPPRG